MPPHLEPWSRLAEAVVLQAVRNGAVGWLRTEWAAALCHLAGIRQETAIAGAMRRTRIRPKANLRADVQSARREVVQ